MTYKDQCKIYEKEIEELQKQVEQLSNDNHVLKTAFITQRKLIEELKCCENCSKYRKGKCKEDTMFYARTLKMCKDWGIEE